MEREITLKTWRDATWLLRILDLWKQFRRIVERTYPKLTLTRQYTACVGNCSHYDGELFMDQLNNGTLTSAQMHDGYRNKSGFWFEVKKLSDLDAAWTNLAIVWPIDSWHCWNDVTKFLQIRRGRVGWNYWNFENHSQWLTGNGSNLANVAAALTDDGRTLKLQNWY